MVGGMSLPQPLRFSSVVRLLGMLVLIMAGQARLTAHDLPQSLVQLDFHRDQVMAKLILPLNDLEKSFKQPLMAAPSEVIARYGPALQTYVLDHIQMVAPDGREWLVNVEVEDMKVTTEEVQPDLVVSVLMRPPAGAPLRKFTLNYSVICHGLETHAALVTLRNDWNGAVFSSHPQMLGGIQGDLTAVQVNLGEGSIWQGFIAVTKLGMHHIAEGTDHLLFLLVLLLPAPLLAVGKRWGAYGGLKRTLWELFKIVSAFTIGHSLTLIAGSLGWLRLPSQPVEIVIAVSIIVSAIHALRPVFAGKEMLVAGGFGLVHGLAFASLISDYGFSAWHLALSILGFNVGIEIMQIIVVLVTIPWLILLSRTHFYTPIRVLLALFSAVVAVGWIGERTFGWANPVEPFVDAFAASAWWVVGTLAVLAVLATLQSGGRRVGEG